MDASTALIVFIAAIVIAVFLGTKLKCNIGVIGIVFAFLIGTIVMGKSIAQVISYFPTSLMFTMMIVAFFLRIRFLQRHHQGDLRPSDLRLPESFVYPAADAVFLGLPCGDPRRGRRGRSGDYVADRLQPFRRHRLQPCPGGDGPLGRCSGRRHPALDKLRRHV